MVILISMSLNIANVDIKHTLVQPLGKSLKLITCFSRYSYPWKTAIPPAVKKAENKVKRHLMEMHQCKHAHNKGGLILVDAFIMNKLAN